MADQEEHWQISESDLQYHQRIGDGANGEVYLVTLQGKDGKVMEAAAKKITSKSSESDQESKRERTHVLEEVDILRKLKHPNIIQFFCAVLQPIIIIVTEYAAQGSLYSYLKEKTKLPSWHRNNWMYQAASAVQYLHQHDIVHLDVKSNNFVIMQNGILKLCDFGTAKNLVQTEEIDCAKGTIPWMAPEIIAELLISKTSDVFSLGVVIWELTTCEIPYDDCHPNYIQYQVAMNKLRPTIPENCPYDVKMLLETCWEDDRNRRPKIDEIVDAITRIMRQEGTRNLPTATVITDASDVIRSAQVSPKGKQTDSKRSDPSKEHYVQGNNCSKSNRIRLAIAFVVLALVAIMSTAAIVGIFHGSNKHTKLAEQDNDTSKNHENRINSVTNKMPIAIDITQKDAGFNTMAVVLLAMLVSVTAISLIVIVVLLLKMKSMYATIRVSNYETTNALSDTTPVNLMPLDCQNQMTTADYIEHEEGTYQDINQNIADTVHTRRTTEDYVYANGSYVAEFKTHDDVDGGQYATL